MKGCLVVLGVFALMVGAFVFALWFGAHRSLTGDAPYTSAAGEVQVTSSVQKQRPVSSGRRNTMALGQQTEYVYRAGSQWYAADAWVRSRDSDRPYDGESIVRAVCFDPDDPADHVLLLKDGAECGDGDVGNVVSSDGVPTKTPSPS